MKPTVCSLTIKLSILVVAVSACSLCGCTNWKKKYGALNVEHQNLKGLYDRERTEKGQLAEEVTKGQQAIEELQKKIAERKQSPAEAAGFGKGYDVAFDPTAGTVTVTLQNAILFDAGKANLKNSTIAELNHIVSVLKRQYRGKRIDVIGHTDSDPIRKSKWKDNWELSTQRALSVVRYLTQRGLPEDKTRAVGCGASRPIASNATSSGKARNRRVEIVVHMRQSS
ncbi:MAG: OmpA family protein [Sedimentisphaerales bacterium]|nr:OmpA family protein [Sedimentisphaerales bacterium]